MKGKRFKMFSFKQELVFHIFISCTMWEVKADHWYCSFWLQKLQIPCLGTESILGKRIFFILQRYSAISDWFLIHDSSPFVFKALSLSRFWFLLISLVIRRPQFNTIIKEYFQLMVFLIFLSDIHCPLHASWQAACITQ